MLKQLQALFAILPFIALFFAPFFLVDITLIYFMEGYFSSLANVLFFLSLFYIIDLAVIFFIESFLTVLSDLFFLKMMGHPFVFTVFYSSIRLMILNLLDDLFRSVDLSIGIRLLIVLASALIEVFFEKLPEKEIQDNRPALQLPQSVQYEIRDLLQRENVVNCIQIIKTRHPQLSKKEIIRAVQLINREMNRR